jgi:preprotein translocase subunit SecA
LRAAEAAGPPVDEFASDGDAAPLGGEPVAEPDEVVNVPVTVDKTPGRNEPCYCGSGKKYKHCHGR